MSLQEFPLRIAKGNAFCNRDKERDKLAKLIQAGHHIWLQALRRHGKTSLILKVYEDFKAKNAPVALHRVDLAFQSNKDEIISALCSGANDMIVELIKTSQHVNEDNLLQKAGNFFQEKMVKFSPQIQFDRGMPSIRFTTPPSLEMLEATLKLLDEIAGERKHRAMFVIDEFQQIGKATSEAINQNKDTSIEGKIRHCLELTTNVTYIFCGSEHSLMQQALEDENRPLYNHTKKITLDRIKSEDYREHIDALWQKRWSKPMSEEVFLAIIHLSQNHPYYVNHLCSELWMLDSPPERASEVESVWQELVEQDSSDYKTVALKLKRNEINLLKALAKEPTSEPTGAKFVRSANVAPGSIMGTIEQLINRDLIYKSNGKYMVINPALAYMAKNS